MSDLSVEPENFAFNTVKGSFATFASLGWAGYRVCNIR
jgi:hypothetical protein